MPNRTPKQQPAPHAAKDAKDVERMRLEHDLITLCPPPRAAMPFIA